MIGLLVRLPCVQNRRHVNHRLFDGVTLLGARVWQELMVQ